MQHISPRQKTTGKRQVLRNLGRSRPQTPTRHTDCLDEDEAQRHAGNATEAQVALSLHENQEILWT